MIRALLVDLDDTLLQESVARAAAARSLFELVAKNGSSEAEQAFLARWSAITVKHFDRYIRGEVSFDQQRRERIHEAIAESLSDTEADRLLERYVHIYEANWRAFPDVVGFLEQHAGIPIAIVTNGQAKQQRAKIRTIGLESKVNGIVISEEVGSSKPAADIFIAACGVLGVPPAQCLCVGDSVPLDIQGAEAAGIPAVLVDRQGVHAQHKGSRVSSLLAINAHAL